MAPRSRERGGGIVAKTPNANANANANAKPADPYGRGTARERRRATSARPRPLGTGNDEPAPEPGGSAPRDAAAAAAAEGDVGAESDRGAFEQPWFFSRRRESEPTVRINAWETETRASDRSPGGSNPSDPAPAPEPTAEEASGENPKARAPGEPEGPSPDDAASPSKLPDPPPLRKAPRRRRRLLKSPPVRRSPGPRPVARVPSRLPPTLGRRRSLSLVVWRATRCSRARLRGRGGGVFRVARDSPRRRSRAGEPRGGAFETARLRSGGVGRVAVPRPRSGPRQGEAQASARAESDGRFPRRARRP